MSSDRAYLLERVDDVAVVQLYADGFTSLSLREKILTWHLYLAALAGRDIYYDQRHALGLDVRAVLEGIVTHPEAIDARVLQEVRRYTKLFWINSGPLRTQTLRTPSPRTRNSHLPLVRPASIASSGPAAASGHASSDRPAPAASKRTGFGTAFTA